MGAIRIRLRRDADVDACLALLHTTHALDDYPPFWPSDPRRFLVNRHEEVAWVAEAVADGEQDGRIVGHIALHDAAPDPLLDVVRRATGLPSDRLVVVARLLVDPDVRRQGLASRLLDHATTAAHASGRRPALDTAKINLKAMALYAAKGWTLAGDVTVDFGAGGSLDMWVYVGPDL